MQVNKKTIFVIIGLIVIVLASVVIFQNKKIAKPVEQEAKNFIPVASIPPDEAVAPSKSVIEIATVTPEVLEEAAPVAPGTSLVTENDIVVTSKGTPVKLNVMPVSDEAPKESAPILLESVPTNENNIKISVSAAGFVPNTFTVKEGQLVNFVLTSTDDFSHVWRLDDRSLIATALGVSGGETRVKSWNAPKKGVYTFHCDIYGHAKRGEVGTMIVE